MSASNEYEMQHQDVKEVSEKHAVYSKVKPGCVSCRKRQIECDKARPSCSRCLKQRLECDFQDSRMWLFESADDLNRAQPPRAHLPVGWKTTKQELDFRFYLENSLSLCCGRADLDARNPSRHSLLHDESGNSWIAGSAQATEDLWGRLLPQIAYHDPLMWQLVCLFGSQHRCSIFGGSANLQEIYLTNYETALSLVTKVAESSCDHAVLILAAYVLFAFQRLSSSPISAEETMFQMTCVSRLVEAFKDNPVVQNHLLPMNEQINSLANSIVLRSRHSTKTGASTNLPKGAQLPEHFRNESHARSWFSKITPRWQYRAASSGYDLSSSYKTLTSWYERLLPWHSRLRLYYISVLDEQPVQAKAAFELIVQYQFFQVPLVLAMNDYRLPT